MHYSTPKLLDCTARRSESNQGSEWNQGSESNQPTELFIVEGDSAASTIARIRDESFQAILPMQGKPMNALKANRQQISSNIQFAALLDALGIELDERPIEPTLERQIRYQKIIMLFDPDPDGIHGRTLMLWFFYRWLPHLLAAGRVFDAHAPQWEITAKDLPHPVYAATPDYLTVVRQHLRDQGIKDIRSQRFRGLGSMPGKLLLTQCVDPNTRELLPLSSKNAEMAIEMFAHFSD